MIYSKGNLVVSRVASTDATDRQLNCVHLAADGSSVASNGRVILAVGPVDAGRVHFPPVDSQDVELPESGVSIPLDVVETATRNIPRDKRASLQCTKLTACRADKVEFTAVTARKELRVGGRPSGEGYPDWQGILSRAGARANKGFVIVSRRDLINCLEAMDEACGAGADDESPVQISFGEPTDMLLLQCVHLGLGQTILGGVSPLDSDGQQLQVSSWAKRLLGRVAKVLKRA